MTRSVYTPSYTPRFTATDNPHGSATAPITSGQLIDAALAPAAAGSTAWVGVAATDAGTGQEVAWWRAGVQRLHTTGTLAVGDLVKCGAAGTAVAYTAGTDAPEALVGIVLAAPDGDGITEVQLVR